MRELLSMFRALAGPACVFALMMTPTLASALSYKVSINPTLNGLDVAFTTQETERLLIVNVTNKTDQKIRCDFTYDAPPQMLFRSTSWVKPDSSGLNNFNITRRLYNVKVDVECKAETD